jgi:putative transposase
MSGAIADQQLMLEQKGFRGEGADATRTQEFRQGDKQVHGENQQFAHDRTLRLPPLDARLPGTGGFGHTTNSPPTGCKTARHRRIPSYYEFAIHTYIRVSGEWKYLYRAVDKAGDTIDFLLRAHRDYAAARRFFERAIDLHGVPEKITIDKSGANTAAIEGIRADSGADIELRQSKYLNNIVEQDHRAIKRIVRPMLGFKNFRCARALIAGIETMHMLKKGQLADLKDPLSSAAEQFYSLAFWRPKLCFAEPASTIATEPVESRYNASATRL